MVGQRGEHDKSPPTCEGLQCSDVFFWFVCLFFILGRLQKRHYGQGAASERNTSLGKIQGKNHIFLSISDVHLKMWDWSR